MHSYRPLIAMWFRRVILYYLLYMVLICNACKETKTRAEMSCGGFGGHPRLSKTCWACRESKKEAEYIKYVIKRHKLLKITK